jgi:hypothetical protein
MKYIITLAAFTTALSGGLGTVWKLYGEPQVKEIAQKEDAPIKEEVKELKKQITKLTDTNEKLSTVLIMSLSDKQRKALKELNDDKNSLLGK